MAKEKWFLTCISNVSIKYKSLTRKGGKNDTYMSHATQKQKS